MEDVGDEAKSSLGKVSYKLSFLEATKTWMKVDDVKQFLIKAANNIG